MCIRDRLLQDLAAKKERGYIDMQLKEWKEGADFPTKSHHFFSGVPYHHVMGKDLDQQRLGTEFVEKLHKDMVV